MAKKDQTDWTAGLKPATAKLVKQFGCRSHSDVWRAVAGYRLRPGALAGYGTGIHREVTEWLEETRYRDVPSLPLPTIRLLRSLGEAWKLVWRDGRYDGDVRDIEQARELRFRLAAIQQAAVWRWAIGPMRVYQHWFLFRSQRLVDTPYRIVKERWGWEESGRPFNLLEYTPVDSDHDEYRLRGWWFAHTGETLADAQRQAYERLLMKGLGDQAVTSDFACVVQAAHEAIKALYPDCFMDDATAKVLRDRARQ